VFAELVTSLLQTLVGLVCCGIIMIFLLVISAFLKQEIARNLTIALVLVPLARIISLSMPLANLSQVYMYMLIYIPFLAAAVIVMHAVGLKFEQIGFVTRHILWQVICGVLIGVALGVVENIIMHPHPVVETLSLKAIWLPALIIFFTTGMVEEIIFRGVLQQTAFSAMG
jgi:uncharacterized protein